MTDYRSLYDKEYIGAWDLGERDVIVIIDRVEAKKIKNTSGEEKRQPVIWFRSKRRPMICNVTNAKTIARLYSKNIEGWIGKPIALYAAQTLAFGETVDCIRVRPEAPTMPSPKALAAEAEQVGA